MGSVLERDHLNKVDLIRTSVSEASSGMLKKVLTRLNRLLIPGVFDDAPPGLQPPPQFKWPEVLDGKGEVMREDEVSGYSIAKVWWQQHVAPHGVQVLLQHEDIWLTW